MYLLLEGLNYPSNKYLDLQKADCKKHAKHNRRYRSFLGFLLSYSILHNDIRINRYSRIQIYLKLVAEQFSLLFFRLNAFDSSCKSMIDLIYICGRITFT